MSSLAWVPQRYFLWLAVLVWGTEAAISVATLKLFGTQVSTAPTASSLLPSYKDGHAYSTPVGGPDVPGRHSASARLKPLAFVWRDGLLYPPLISWLQREEAGPSWWKN